MSKLTEIVVLTDCQLLFYVFLGEPNNAVFGGGQTENCVGATWLIGGQYLNSTWSDVACCSSNYTYYGCSKRAYTCNTIHNTIQYNKIHYNTIGLYNAIQ